MAAPIAADPAGRPRLARHVRLRYDAKRDRHVLLGPETVVVLNGTGADVLALCDGTRTTTGILAGLRERYGRIAEDEVLRFLAALAARRWLESGDG